ncbi:hypothetical protein P0D88_46690 [Paraburkholderia sp. RL18-103-BIB-C]|uniref:hypothetical protein n=1 Tax=Paraburkholderia sp. RL18-103-BIB-C TaxID=3031637 RepID=UPI0038B72087
MPPPANDKITGTTEKRGRGRPRKPDAMSNAERQAAWRARDGARTKSVTVTKNILPPASAHDALVRECEQLRGELERARRKLETASRATPSDRVPSDVAAVLERLPRPDDADSGERRLNLMINGARIFALERLVARFGLPRRAVIERLIDWADDTLSRSLYEDEAAFNRYIDRAVTKNRSAR